MLQTFIFVSKIREYLLRKDMLLRNIILPDTFLRKVIL